MSYSDETITETQMVKVEKQVRRFKCDMCGATAEIHGGATCDLLLGWGVLQRYKDLPNIAFPNHEADLCPDCFDRLITLIHEKAPHA